MLEVPLIILGSAIAAALVVELLLLPIRSPRERRRYGLKDHRPGKGSHW